MIFRVSVFFTPRRPDRQECYHCASYVKSIVPGVAALRLPPANIHMPRWGKIKLHICHGNMEPVPGSCPGLVCNAS